MTAQIEVEDLHLHLGSSSGGTNALDGVSLHVNEGQRLGLVGGSGAGKSTLLKVMMALRQPDSCLLYTSPSPRDRQKSRMPSSA